MFDLNGKTALVTGASGGIGKDIARALHASGAVVALSGTRQEALETLAAELGGRAHVLPCDLSDKARPRRWSRRRKRRWAGSTFWSTTPESPATCCSCA